MPVAKAAKKPLSHRGQKREKKAPAPSENAFVGSRSKPTRAALVGELGPAARLWDEVAARGKDEFGLTEEWKTYSPKYGWAMRLKRKERNIIHLSPCRGYFLAVMILGDRAVAAAKASGLPKRVLAILDDAPKYPEGTGLRIPVRTEADLEGLSELMQIKLEN